MIFFFEFQDPPDIYFNKTDSVSHDKGYVTCLRGHLAVYSHAPDPLVLLVLKAALVIGSFAEGEHANQCS